ncbi:MAG: ketopantoate reductase family protein, partial [Candidatus Ornithospirochaeta sp.]
GSVGCNIAYNLRNAGDLCFAVDESRRDKAVEDIVFNGTVLPVPTIVARKDEEKADLVIVAVKNFNLHSALGVIAPFVGEETVILPVLNGIEAEGVISEKFGIEKVLWGFISGLSVFREGNIVTSFSGGKITFGERDNSLSQRILSVRDYLTDNGQDAVVPEDIRHEKWLKFMTNTCFNTLTAILEATYGATSENSHMIRASRLIAREVQRVAEKEGVVLTQEDVETMIRNTCSLTGNGRSSMLEDLLSGRETENCYFALAISRKGKKYGIPTPYSDMVGILLEAKRYVREYR